MDVPQTFIDDLDIDFQGRLRARFSGKQQAIVIEQKVGRNILPSLPRRMFDTERKQSLAEGYMPIMTVAASEQMRCQECGYRLDVPFCETREIRCPYCKLKGRNTRVYAGFYPLNAKLIHHLKSIDPLRNMDVDQIGQMNDYNERKTEQMQKQLYDDAESYANDNINKLMGIPTFGYAGTKTFTGN